MDKRHGLETNTGPLLTQDTSMLSPVSHINLHLVEVSSYITVDSLATLGDLGIISIALGYFPNLHPPLPTVDFQACARVWAEEKYHGPSRTTKAEREMESGTKTLGRIRMIMQRTKLLLFIYYPMYFLLVI